MSLRLRESLNAGNVLVQASLKTRTGLRVQDGPAPGGPLISMDFVNEVYEVNGATVALSALFGENDDWGGWNPATGIDPGTGWIGGSPAAQGVLLEAVLGGKAVVIDYVAYTETPRVYAFDSPDYDTNLIAWFPGGNGGHADFNDEQTNADPVLNGFAHRGAAIITSTAVTMSVDGAANIVATGAVADPLPNAVGFDILHAGTIVTALRVYDTTDAAQLPTLSIPDVPLPALLVEMDFQNGTYLVNGEAVALATLFTEDAANWGDWDPAVAIVPAQGWTGTVDSAPFVIGPLLEGLLAGKALVMDYTPQDQGPEVYFFDNPDYDTNIQMRGNGTEVGLLYFNAASVEPPGVEGPLIRTAWMANATDAYISSKGNAPSHVAGTADPLPNAVGMAIIGFPLLAITTLRLYDTTDPDDLPKLSKIYL